MSSTTLGSFISIKSEFYFIFFSSSDIFLWSKNMMTYLCLLQTKHSLCVLSFHPDARVLLEVGVYISSLVEDELWGVNFSCEDERINVAGLAAADALACLDLVNDFIYGDCLGLLRVPDMLLIAVSIEVHTALQNFLGR